MKVAIIDPQAARGTSSHFNVATRFDATLFGVMGIAILTLWLASVAVMLALFRQPFRDAAWGWVLKLAMLSTVLGSATGGLMTQPNAEQRHGWEAGDSLTVSGAHTGGGTGRRAGNSGCGVESRPRRSANSALSWAACNPVAAGDHLVSAKADGGTGLGLCGELPDGGWHFVVAGVAGTIDFGARLGCFVDVGCVVS